MSTETITVVETVRIDDHSRGQDGALPGYYIVSGEGDSYRCYMWAANLRHARKALAAVKRELRAAARARVTVGAA